MAGKGSAPRPFSVDHKTFSNNWERIFGKKGDVNVNETTENKDSNENSKEEKKDDSR